MSGRDEFWWSQSLCFLSDHCSPLAGPLSAPKIAPCSAARWHQQPSKCFKMSMSQQRFIASSWPWVFSVEPAQVSSAGSRILVQSQPFCCFPRRQEGEEHPFEKGRHKMSNLGSVASVWGYQHDLEGGLIQRQLSRNWITRVFLLQPGSLCAPGHQFSWSRVLGMWPGKQSGDVGLVSGLDQKPEPSVLVVGWRFYF